MFYSRSKRPTTICAPCGVGTSPKYEERIVDGVIDLVKTGIRDVHTFIQQSKESCDVYNILDRFSKGDISAIQRVKGYYADVTAMPKSLMEVHNFMKTLNSHFDELPAEVKEKFGNSSHQFMKSVENGELSKILGQFVQSDKDGTAGKTGKDAQKEKEDN